MKSTKMSDAVAHIDDALIERCLSRKSEEAGVEEEVDPRSFAGLRALSVPKKAALAAIVLLLAAGLGITGYAAANALAAPEKTYQSDSKAPVLHLKAEFKSGENGKVWHPEGYVEKTASEEVEFFFNSEVERGFIALVIPDHYEFFYSIVPGGEATSFRVRSDSSYSVCGYAECVCRVEKVSSEYDSSESKPKPGELVRFRQQITLRFPVDSEKTTSLLKENGFYNDDPLEGADCKSFRIPDEYITEDCVLWVSEGYRDIPLVVGEEYYVFVSEKTYFYNCGLVDWHPKEEVEPELKDEIMRLRAACPAGGPERIDENGVYFPPGELFSKNDIMEYVSDFYDFVVSHDEIFD